MRKNDLIAYALRLTCHISGPPNKKIVCYCSLGFRSGTVAKKIQEFATKKKGNFWRGVPECSNFKELIIQQWLAWNRWLNNAMFHKRKEKEGNILFNDALNTFYLRLYDVRHMVKDHSDSERGNLLRHMGYSFRLVARVLLYASFHRQECYTSRGALAGTRNSSIVS